MVATMSVTMVVAAASSDRVDKGRAVARLGQDCQIAREALRPSAPVTTSRAIGNRKNAAVTTASGSRHNQTKDLCDIRR